jgi:hypothetical protein
MRITTHKKGDLSMTIDPNIPDFNKSSFAIKKAEKARATIAKHGLPKEDKPSRKSK